MEQIAFDFSTPMPQGRLADVVVETAAPEFIFNMGGELIIGKTLEWLESIMSGKEFKQVKPLLKRAFQVYAWNSNDLNRVLTCISENRFHSLHDIAAVIVSYTGRPRETKFHKPFARLLSYYSFIQQQASQSWAKQALISYYLPAMEAQGCFGNPGGIKSEVVLEDEILKIQST